MKTGLSHGRSIFANWVVEVYQPYEKFTPPKDSSKSLFVAPPPPSVNSCSPTWRAVMSLGTGTVVWAWPTVASNE
jgi:hypothetical protein